MGRIRVGVIGCGKIAEVGHLPWLKRHPDVEITALADPYERNLVRAAKRYKVRHTFTDPMALIASREVDAVVICSPQWAHREQALAALKENLHVLCEKPLAPTLAESDAILAEAKKHPHLIFQVAFQKRFQRGFEVMREMVQAGAIGEPFHVHVYWYNWIPDFELPWMKKLLSWGKRFGVDPARDMGAWRQLDSRSGGGDFLDHGPHYLDLFRYWFGEITHVSAHIRKLHPSFVYEDQANVLLRFANGMTGSIERSMNIVGRPHGEEIGYIHGTKGTLHWDAPHEYTLKPVKVRRYATPHVILNHSTPVFYSGRSQKSYDRQMRYFIGRIKGKPAAELPLGGLASSLEDGRRAIELVESCYRASQELTTVVVAPQQKLVNAGFVIRDTQNREATRT